MAIQYNSTSTVNNLQVYRVPHTLQIVQEPADGIEGSQLPKQPHVVALDVDVSFFQVECIWALMLFRLGL